MPRKSSGKPTGCPLIPIDWKLVDQMILAGSSGIEIAGALDVCHDTFYDRFRIEHGVAFSAYRAKRRFGGHGMLRIKQFQSAMRGNTAMMKILGEEWLGQGKGNSESSDDSERNEVLAEQSRQEMAASLHERTTVLSGLEDEQPLSHQECTGEEDQVRDELGTKDSMGGKAQL
jgi:hypothetical protein